ncbi:MAG: LysR family transcriptional regulator, partial [Acidimicrobiales bacterium]|nr:LysR family transcriptional regulator [Acidimicrobiales bacterium]
MLPSVAQLRFFLAVAEEGQFTRAADRLHVAQPSVSAQIRRLEGLLRTPLFHRGPGPVTLTDAGAALLPIARRIVGDLASIEDELAGLDELLRGHVAVGATPSLSATLLPSVLGRFHRLYPGVVIRVSEDGSPQLLEELHAGTLDLALAIAPVPAKGLASVPLAEEELVVVTTPDHPL